MRKLVSTVIVAGFACAGGLVHAQTLADVARREEQRRQSVAQPSKVYTNQDLKPVPPVAPPPAAAEDVAAAGADAAVPEKDTADADTTNPAAEPAKAPPAAAAMAQDKKPAEAKPAEPVKDRAYWADRQKALQEQLDRDRTLAESLQSRINALTTDFINRDDPAQKAAIERDRAKTIFELNRQKQVLSQDQKALAEFQEEARRAAVPPGWLR